MNEATIQATTEALNTRELLKIRVLDAAPLTAREVGRALVERVEGARVVQTIGHVLVIYRPFPENPDIRLPA